MILIDLLKVLYEETVVDISIDFSSVFTGEAIAAQDCPYINCPVLEVYVDIDDKTLVISVRDTRRKNKKKEK